MSDPITVTGPLINPNEPEARLTSLLVVEGQQVKAGDLLCTLETTKSTVDVFAEASGFVAGLRFAEGETVHAGDLLCYLAPSAGWKPPEQKQINSAAPEQSSDGREYEVPAGVRISQPALALAKKAGIDLTTLPAGPLITESMLRGMITQQPENAAQTENIQHESPIDPNKIVIYGGGGHGKMVIDLLRALKLYQIEGIIDDGLPVGAEVMGVPVLGGAEILPQLRARGIVLALNAVAGISNVSVRIRVYEKLTEAGFAFPPVIHPSAVVEPSAQLGPGVQVLAKAYVGSEARIGFGSIINTGAIVSHDCVLGDYATISPGAILAGEVQAGSRVLVGMGATVNFQTVLGEGAMIGNGATVKADVPERGIVRAGTIWPESTRLER